MSFVEIGAVPSEITAIAARGGTLYIAFEDQGIKRYELGSPRDGIMVMKKNTTFRKNSEKAKYPKIHHLVVGWSVNRIAVYAVAGDDKIYRFSEEGIPDYPVEVVID